MLIPENILFINLLIGVFIILSILNGVRKGFVLQIIDLIGLLFALWVASQYALIMALSMPLFSVSENANIFELLSNKFLNIGVWFILIVVAIKLLLFLLRPLIKVLTKLPIVSSINKLLGGVMGVVVAFVWLMIALNVLRLPYFENGYGIIEHSLLKKVDEYTFVASDYLLNKIIHHPEIESFIEGYIYDFVQDDIIKQLLEHE